MGGGAGPWKSGGGGDGEQRGRKKCGLHSHHVIKQEEKDIIARAEPWGKLWSANPKQEMGSPNARGIFKT